MYVALAGYMGSGKTTIGRIVSIFLEKKKYDLDEFIINWKNQNIHIFFFKNGENNFRKIETEVLYFIQNIKKNIIFTTGGGTPCFRNNIYFLERLFITFYLHFSSKEIFQRIRYQKYKRPLISSISSDKLLYFIHEHFSNRIKYYDKLNSKIEIVNRLTEEIIFLIHNQLSLLHYKYVFIKQFK